MTESFPHLSEFFTFWHISLQKLTWDWAATCLDTSEFTCSAAANINNVFSVPAVCSVSAHRVHLSEHRTLSEEQWLPGVHQDQIKVGLPGPVGGAGLGTNTHTQAIRQTSTYEHMSIMCLSRSPVYSIHVKVWSKGKRKKSYVLPLGHGESQTGRSWFSVRTQCTDSQIRRSSVYS